MSMDNLYEVCNCLSFMDSSKVTERKKGATQLELLLGRGSITEVIDSNTAQGTAGSRVVTWDVVLKGVIRYVDTEITTLQSAKESQSTTTLNNRDKKKQELSSLFRLVIRTANKGTVKLSYQLLAERIESMLIDTYTLESFGTDYCRMFLKYVLQVRQYWLEISPDKWRKLTTLFCKLYDESRVDRRSLAWIIQEVIHGSCTQGEPYPRRIFSFFTQVMENIRDVKDTSVIESILVSLNTFCKTVAPNNRVQLCYFGESQMNGFVFLWNKLNTDKIKEELIQFLHLLVRAHHPHGTTEPGVGAYAHDWDLWKRQVSFLHEMIVTDIDKLTDRYKFISGAKGCSLSYVAFAVDVFKQMPVSKLAPPDLSPSASQISQSSNQGDAGPTKRQKMSMESKSLLEIISDRSNTLQAVPWLQVLHHLLSKYPESFGAGGLIATVQVMTGLLAECKKGQLFRFIFEVLSALIKAIQQFDDLKEQTASGMTTLWSLCVSSINSRQAEIEGYQECGLHAMACMINSNLVSPTKEIWNLFLPTFIQPNPAADQLLTSLITTQGLPENHVPSIVGAPLDKNLRGRCFTFPLRQSLITWLLPITDTDSGLQFKAALSAVRVAEILHGLTLQDPSVINRDLSSDRTADSSSHSSVMESVYLKSTFDYQAKECQALDVNHDRLNHHEKKASQEGSPHISGMLELLVKQLFLLSNNLDQQNLEFLSWFSCLLARLLYLLREESTVVTNIQCILKKVLGKMATALVLQLQKQLTASCTSSLMLLNAVLTWEEETNLRMFLVTDYIRSCLPASFVDVLVDVAGGKFNKRNDSKPELSKRPSGYSEKKEPGSTRKVDLDMEFELFDKIRASHFSENNDLDATFDVEDSINDAEAGAEARQDISDFLSKESLTEADLVQILCSEVLCRITAYDRRQLDGTSNQNLIRAEMDIDHVVTRLLRLISPECYDPSQSVCVHLLLAISKYFLTCDHEVTLKNIKLILTAFKQTAKELVKDQQVCCQLLSHLRYIIPHLSADEDSTSDELKFCRDVFLKFVSDFWHLASDSKPLLKYEIAQTLLDLLKHDPDCTWGHLQIASSDDGAQGSSLCTVFQHFPKLLTEGNIVLRTLVAESLKWLLVRCDNKGCETFRDKSTQKRAFERVFELCSELLDIQQGNLNDERWQDELHNRQATCLQSLLTIIVTSPVCEKPCLLGLCQVVAERNIPLDMVRKMLSIICWELSFVDIKSYLACHLPYLIHNWLHKKMVNSSLAQFPYKLLGYADLEQFVRSHTNLIVSELLITRLNIADIQAALNPCHIDVHEALVSALPIVLTHVLPAFAVKLHEAPGSHPSKGFADATDCFTIIVSELSEKTIKDCTYENLGDIIVGVLNCLNIEKDAMGSKSLSMVYPKPNPPHYSQSRIQVTLDYLAQNFIAASEPGNATLITVLAKIPGGLYQVLLSLATLIWQEHRAHNQQRHLQMYRLFVNMLLKELGGGLDGGWASIIREVINRLLIILMDRAHNVVVTSPSYEEDVVLTTLDILHTLCTAALQTCPEEMTNYIHRIVDAVADTVTLSENICTAATDFLTTLLSAPVNDTEDLTKAMRILNPLPVTSGLAQLRAHLEQKCAESKQPLKVRLENLLEVCLLMSHNPSQGLAIRLNHLAGHLAHRHGEIQKLVKTSQGLLILKKVLYELIKMATSQHQEVAVASAACLGAIGPVDLQSLSFPHHPVETSHVVAGEVFKSHSYGKYCWLFHALDSCLLDKSLDVVKTAGVILKKIMATGSGCRFEAEYSKALKNRSFLFHYLHPFKSIVSKHTGMPPPPALNQTDSDSFKMLVDKPELWLGCSNNSNPSHEVWIKDLTTALLNTGAVQDEIVKMIGPMCALKSEFCEESLPFLIHDILRGGNEEIRHVLSANISSFFHSHCVYSQDSTSNAAARPVSMNKQSVRTMLNVVQYLRKQSRPKDRQEVPQTAWHNNFWIDFDYLQVARAAQYCSANFSAVLFTEIWWETQRSHSSATGSTSNSQTSDLSQESQLDPLTLVSSQGETGQKVQELLLDVYRSIGDPDGIYGCGAGKLPHPMTRVQTYLHEQQQAKALTTLDIGVTHNTSSVSLLLQAVESCGADYILQRCLSELTYCRDESSSSSSSLPVSSAGVADELQEFFYQSSWRLGQWDVNLSAKQSKLPMFHQSLYRAMVSLKDDHLSIAKQALDMARSSVVSRFDPHVESCKSLYPFLSNLQCFTYLQQVLDIVTKANSSSSEELLDLFAANSGNNFLSTQAVHFEHEKSLLEIMTSMARILTSKGSKQGETLETNALWGLAVGGRKARHFQLAEKALHSLKDQIRSQHSLVTLEHVQLEEAKLFWARNEVDIAKNILKNLIVKLSKDFADDGNDLFLYPEALCTYGNWLAETRSEAPVVIFREYLEKTVDLMKGNNPASTGSDYTALDGYFSLARFADEQYQQIADHLRSPAFEDKQHLLGRLRSELKDCQESKTQGKYVKIMERTLDLDSEEIKSLQEGHRQFLLQALLNYLECLKSGDVYNLKVFRIVALWFENSKNVKVNALIKKHIGAIQTYKFLPLYYQLAARMSSDTKDGSNFQTVLMQLMQKVAIDHPHHALWIIMALAHAYKDDELLNKGQDTARTKTASDDNQIEEERVQAAKSMLEKLRQVDKKLADIVTNVEKISIAYIELANWKVVNKTDRRPQQLPKELAILRITDCDNISLPSVDLKVDPSGSYKNIISPVRFGTTFRLAGGLNLPKIITCVGSDGRERTQLVKGQDDLRQDAVMQQVFTLVNELLVGDDETRKRQLKIQTYKVIPLSQKCGLLQWCEGTQPLGEYLIGSKGAHVRYRPGDLSPIQCRQLLASAVSKPEDKLKAYQEICAKFKPVFHHFFMEHFLEPSVWFEKRLAYTRSVATNSIVGYILGLGDRHPMNILIDLQSAEVVHIDLGIAFEQGRILPTPETVPFRLSRDIVDGMGITGVEGVFRRCCEKTMEVMKGNSESLLTIVQVLLYDPLSHWSLTPQQALAIQRKREQANLDTLDMSLAASGQVPASGQVSSSGQAVGQSTSADKNIDSRETQNKLAERTLLRLRQKLSGQEDGVPLSVTGQVNLLIQKASDPENLCMLYPGWQAYL